MKAGMNKSKLNMKKVKSGKRDVKREGERVEIKRRCLEVGVQQCFRGLQFCGGLGE